MPAAPKQTAPQRKTDPPARKTQPKGQQPAPAAPSIQRGLADPLGTSPGEILALQQTVGNRAVSRMLASAPAAPPANGKPRLQFKLAVGPAGDQYEQEADRVAGQVMRMSEPVAPPEQEEAVGVQRAVDDEAEDGLAQRQAARPEAGFEAGPEIESRLAANQGGGKPLPGDTRTFMEGRFGADFSGVRVHTGGEAAQLNRAMSAQAFTHGADIYMGAGKYEPGTSAGKQLLAHELTHTIQQGASPTKVQTKRMAATPPRYESERTRQIARQVARPLLRAAPEAVQRAIGFEFETTWGVMKRTESRKGLKKLGANTEPAISGPEFIQMGGQKREGLENLTKGEVVAEGNRFEMQADVEPTGSDLEFVAPPKPPGFDVPGERGALQSTMTDLVKLTSKLVSLRDKYPGRMFSAEYVGGHTDTLILPNQENLNASPQVTGGIELGRLSSLMSDLGHDKQSGNRSQASQTFMGLASETERQAVHDAVAKAKTACAGLRQTNAKRGGPALEGLLSLMLAYILVGDRAESEFSYAKHIAVIMSRTDLGSLFNSLPDDDRLPFADQPNVFVPFVLGAAGLDGTAGSAMYAKGFKEMQFNPGRGEWIGGICRGVDLMSDAGAKAEGKLQKLDEEGNENVEFEGMGKLGNRFEPVGPEIGDEGGEKKRAQGAVFELRRIQKNLPAHAWPGFAEDTFNYFEQIGDPSVAQPQFVSTPRQAPVKKEKTRFKRPKLRLPKFKKKAPEIVISGPTGGRSAGQSSMAGTDGGSPQALTSSPSPTVTVPKGVGKQKSGGFFKRLKDKLFSKKPKMEITISGPAGGRFQSEKSNGTGPKPPKVPIQQEFFQQPKWVDHFFTWTPKSGEPDRINRALTDLYVQSLVLTTGALTYSAARSFFDNVLKPAASDPLIAEMIYLDDNGKETEYTVDQLDGFLASEEAYEQNKLGRKIISSIPQNLSYHVLAFYSAYVSWLKSSEGQLDLASFWGTPTQPVETQQPSTLTAPTNPNGSNGTSGNVKQLAQLLEGQIHFGPK